MAFNTDLQGPDLSGITAGPARAPADTSGERDRMLTQAAGIAATTAGKAYAAGSAAEVAGVDMSLEQANAQADVVDQQIEAALLKEQDRVEGPIHPSGRRAQEIKDAQLSEFANNDRVLLALRDRGTISTTEAKARRTLNLKRALSNPINSMFRNDFINAAKDLTGGGAGDDMFQETPEEKQNRVIREKQAEAVAKFEAEVTDHALRTNQPMDVARVELQAQREDLDTIARLNAVKAERELTSIEHEEDFATGRSAGGREVSSYIKELVAETGGAGLEATQMAGGTRMIEGLYQKQLTALNNAKGISGPYRDAERARLTNWRDGQLALLKAHDRADLDKAQLTQMDNLAQKVGWANMGEVMALKAIDPRLFDIFLKSGGNIQSIMDATLGDKRGTAFIQAAKKIRSLGSWTQGKPVESPDAVADFLNSQGGQEYLGQVGEESPEKQQQISDATKKIYADSTEKSLNAFTTGFSTMQALNSGGKQFVRKEISNAMSIARDKGQFLLKHKGAGGRVEIIKQPKQHRDHVPVTELHIPEGMAEHQKEFRAIYKVIQAHRWAWEHVQDDYFDAADAFNGYMRGEWDIDLNLEEGVGRVKPEVPTEATKMEEPTVTQPDFGDVQELQELLKAEEEGAPTDEQEARLTELLEQRVAIRDKKRTGGLPVDPRTEVPEQKKVEVGRHGDSNYSSISQKLFKFEGGFQNDPDDKGNYVDGKLIGTNLGISAAQYERLFGEKPTEEKMKALTKEEVDAAYKKEYWDANRVGEMPPELQEIAMNMFVMTSPKNVIKAIQRASGAKEDGILGPQTLKAMRGTTKEEIWEEYHNYLKSLKNYSKFGKGWQNRYKEILNA